MIALPLGFDLKCNEGPRDGVRGCGSRRGWVRKGDPARAMLHSYNEFASRMMMRDERRRISGEGEEMRGMKKKREGWRRNEGERERERDKIIGVEKKGRKSTQTMLSRRTLLAQVKGRLGGGKGLRVEILSRCWQKQLPARRADSVGSTIFLSCNSWFQFR